MSMMPRCPVCSSKECEGHAEDELEGLRERVSVLEAKLGEVIQVLSQALEYDPSSQLEEGDLTLGHIIGEVDDRSWRRSKTRVYVEPL